MLEVSPSLITSQPYEVRISELVDTFILNNPQGFTELELMRDCYEMVIKLRAAGYNLENIDWRRWGGKSELDGIRRYPMSSKISGNLWSRVVERKMEYQEDGCFFREAPDSLELIPLTDRTFKLMDMMNTPLD